MNYEKYLNQKQSLNCKQDIYITDSENDSEKTDDDYYQMTTHYRNERKEYRVLPLKPTKSYGQSWS